MRCHLPMMVAAVLAACALQAQPANPLSDEARQAYTPARDAFLKMAERMPEENYSFKPAPLLKRNFGQGVAHIADTQARTCSAVIGETGERAEPRISKLTKTDMLAALRQAFAICDRAYDSLTDATARQMIKMNSEHGSKLGVLWANTAHLTEEFNKNMVYVRLTGVGH